MASTLAIAGLMLGGGFGTVAVSYRFVRDFAFRHAEKCKASSMALDRFHEVASGLLGDPKTPDEIIQVVVFMNERVGHPFFAKEVLAGLRAPTTEPMRHLLEYLPHDTSEDHSKSLVELVRSGVYSSAALTMRPGRSMTTIQDAVDAVLVAVVVSLLDC